MTPLPPQATRLVKAHLVTLATVVSSLGYAILALLATKSQSGYDLARQMRPPLGFLWQAKHGQIYPELARLVKEGLVDFERIDKRSGPPRRVHSITARGRSELTSWVIKSPQAKPMNDELVVKAYALRRAPRAKASSLIRSELTVHEHRLAALEQIAEALKSRTSAAIGPDSPRFGELAALRRAIGSEREYLAWCRWLLSELGFSGDGIEGQALRRAAGVKRSHSGQRRTA
jgi:DNA-binding PadR family transcriptional regulator